MLRIVADEDILALDSQFSRFGELVKLPGRSINSGVLANADVLLVRSITRVDRLLLESTPVKFVGSATSGIDHVDTGWLRSAGIGFADAAGANARAVVEYCLAAIVRVAANVLDEPAVHSVGLIGVGNVGGLLCQKLLQIGFAVKVCDPLLAGGRRQELEDAGAEFCDIAPCLRQQLVSLHVPLVLEGKHPTYHMLGEDQLQVLPRGGLLLNTSRGAVIDNMALSRVLRERPDISSIIDVWEGEPQPELELVSRCRLATPHVAGYSLDAKRRASKLVAEALARFFNVLEHELAASEIENTDTIVIPDCPDGAGSNLLDRIMQFGSLDAGMKNARRETVGATFDLLRKSMVNRREFANYQLEASHMTNAQIRLYSSLGFNFKY